MKTKPYELKSTYTLKVQYGRSESRKAIADVLDSVLNTYKYTSLAELNAILNQYNVLADRGGEESRVHQNHGLLYRILDEKGNTIGVPIKASSFHNKPTLKYLEERFTSNDAARQSHKARVKNAIDLALLKQPKKHVETLVRALEKEGIHTVLRQNKDGIIYGLTYVDHRTKCVFNGSDLGKQYSAKGKQERCNQNDLSEHNKVLQNQHTTKQHGRQNNFPNKEQMPLTDLLTASNIDKAVDDLIQPTQGANYVPHQWKKRKKKKRINISKNS